MQGLSFLRCASPAIQRRRVASRDTPRPVAAAAPAAAEGTGAFRPAKPTLFSTPISNCSARNRWVIYKKGLEGEIDTVAPQKLGGLKSEQYLALNPQGKMPLLVLPDGTALPESQVIESYLLDKYRGRGPDLLPRTPEARARAALAARILDLYITPIQGCMYKQMGGAERAEQLARVAFQLDVLEGVVEGPFVAGSEISYADAALFPTFVFFVDILPRHFGWQSVFAERPKLQRWWEAVQADPEATRVIAEMRTGLESWEAAKRWETTGIAQQVADGSYNWSCA